MNPLELIKKLREATSMGVSDCRQALSEAKGDYDRALELLKRRGIEIAAKKSERQVKAGIIGSYTHFNKKMGAMVEVNSETDFVANNEEFQKFASELAQHIAAMSPRYIKKDDVPEDILKGQPDQDSFYKTFCVMEQPFVKNPAITIKDYLNTMAGKFGENIVIRRFVRYQVGYES